MQSTTALSNATTTTEMLILPLGLTFGTQEGINCAQWRIGNSDYTVKKDKTTNMVNAEAGGMFTAPFINTWGNTNYVKTKVFKIRKDWSFNLGDTKLDNVPKFPMMEFFRNWQSISSLVDDVVYTFNTRIYYTDS